MTFGIPHSILHFHSLFVKEIDLIENVTIISIGKTVGFTESLPRDSSSMQYNGVWAPCHGVLKKNSLIGKIIGNKDAGHKLFDKFVKTPPGWRQ